MFQKLIEVYSLPMVMSRVKMRYRGLPPSFGVAFSFFVIPRRISAEGPLPSVGVTKRGLGGIKKGVRGDTWDASG
jgi:hypothetical protein